MPSVEALHERNLVTTRDGRRPYGAKLVFQVSHAASIGNIEEVSVLLESGAIAAIQPARSASWEGGRKFQVTLDGFLTATTAETEGLRLAQSILLMATSLNFGLRLIYHGHLPAMVYERFRSTGPSAWGEGVDGWSPQIVLEEFIAAYQVGLFDPTIVLSMELYCAALLEPNERARFVTAVSALEPLAKQESLGDGVNAFVDSTLGSLSAAPNVDPTLLTSLRGRVEQLRRESVRQALLRCADSWFPGRTDLRRQIDRAYGLRSELLHNGTLTDPDCDLGGETDNIAKILRSIYARASGRALRVPVGV